MGGLKGPRTPECEDGCRLLDERGDRCRPGICYARLTPTAYWDQSERWVRTPEPDVAGRDVLAKPARPATERSNASNGQRDV